MKERIIEKEWESLIDCVLPGLDSESIQYKEMRSAFFAGYLSYHTLLYNMIKEKKDTKGILDTITEELNEFIDFKEKRVR